MIIYQITWDLLKSKLESSKEETIKRKEEAKRDLEELNKRRILEKNQLLGKTDMHLHGNPEGDDDSDDEFDGNHLSRMEYLEQNKENLQPSQQQQQPLRTRNKRKENSIQNNRNTKNEAIRKESDDDNDSIDDDDNNDNMRIATRHARKKRNVINNKDDNLDNNNEKNNKRNKRSIRQNENILIEKANSINRRTSSRLISKVAAETETVLDEASLFVDETPPTRRKNNRKKAIESNLSKSNGGNDVAQKEGARLRRVVGDDLSDTDDSLSRMKGVKSTEKARRWKPTESAGSVNPGHESLLFIDSDDDSDVFESHVIDVESDNIDSKIARATWSCTNCTYSNEIMDGCLNNDLCCQMCR